MAGAGRRKAENGNAGGMKRDILGGMKRDILGRGRAEAGRCPAVSRGLCGNSMVEMGRRAEREVTVACGWGRVPGRKNGSGWAMGRAGRWCGETCSWGWVGPNRWGK